MVNPEFLREGRAYEDTARPWRIVLGVDKPAAAGGLLRLYRSLYRESIPRIITDWQSAELIKLAANVYLSHRLAFIHEIADFARMAGLDLDSIRRGIGLDPRIGLDYFEPGLGFGGSCLPKDCRLINSSEATGWFQFKTARTALHINDRVIENLVKRLQQRIGPLRGKKLALLGVAFKPQVDDTRHSPAVRLALGLQRRGAILACHDPYLKNSSRVPATELPLEPDPYLVLHSATAVIIGTAHEEFRRLKPLRVARQVAGRVVCDYFGILNRKTWSQAGFEFI